jgi:spore coat protein CotH
MLLNRMRALAVLTILAAASPAATLAQTPGPTNPADPTAPAVAADPADRFFDDTVLHDIKLTCNSRDWEALKEHYLDDTYYICDFRWSDQVLRNIGIRSRGTGSRSGAKPGLRVDFDRYTTNQKLLGLKSVILRNNTQDPSGLRERLGMLMFRRMGLKGLREAHARLFINNSYAGLYTMVESVDKSWLQKNYGENDGYLYEFKFANGAPEPFAFRYLGADPALYVPIPFKPETHESAPRPEVFERLIWAVDAVGDSTWRRTMEEFLDLRAFVTHLAIENFLAEEDGITGDYGPNNFYFYRPENSNRFLFIPWDKSNTFWHTDYSLFRNIDDGIPSHQNRLAIRALADPELRELYRATVLKCAESVLADPALTPGPVPTADVVLRPAPPDMPGWLETEIARDYAQIHDAALADPAKLATNEEFENSIAELVTFARNRSDFVRRQLDIDRALHPPRR